MATGILIVVDDTDSSRRFGVHRVNVLVGDGVEDLILIPVKDDDASRRVARWEGCSSIPEVSGVAMTLVEAKDPIEAARAALAVPAVEAELREALGRV